MINETVWISGITTVKLINKTRAGLHLESLSVFRDRAIRKARKRLDGAIFDAAGNNESRHSTRTELEKFDHRFRESGTEAQEQQQWKEVKIGIPKRKQIAVIEGKINPWLDLPTPTHETLAWNYFSEKFPDKSV